jgi:F0F1-type ATP synthase alpha subunit
MPWYKLTKGSIGLIIDDKSVDIEKGDTIELSEEIAKKYKYLKRVGQPVSLAVQPTSGEGKAEIARDWSNTQNMKAPDVIALIKEEESEDDLLSLQGVEEQGLNRVGVLKEIEKRLSQIGG